MTRTVTAPSPSPVQSLNKRCGSIFREVASDESSRVQPAALLLSPVFVTIGKAQRFAQALPKTRVCDASQAHPPRPSEIESPRDLRCPAPHPPQLRRSILSRRPFKKSSPRSRAKGPRDVELGSSAT